MAPVCRPVGSARDFLVTCDIQIQTVESWRWIPLIIYLTLKVLYSLGRVTRNSSYHIERLWFYVHIQKKDILPFSSKSETGSFFKLFLSCGFFQKDVEVAVRAELPVMEWMCF